MNYNDWHKKALTELGIKEVSTDNDTKVPAIPITIIDWLKLIYPIKRYHSYPTEFDAGLDEGHLEVIDRLLLEHNRQMEKS